jgi:hypothetical protein
MKRITPINEMNAVITVPGSKSYTQRAQKRLDFRRYGVLDGGSALAGRGHCLAGK